MKKLYEELELEIIRFKSEDVIVTSTGDDIIDVGEETPGVGPEGV